MNFFDPEKIVPNIQETTTSYSRTHLLSRRDFKSICVGRRLSPPAIGDEGWGSTLWLSDFATSVSHCFSTREYDGSLLHQRCVTSLYLELYLSMTAALSYIISLHLCYMNTYIFTNIKIPKESIRNNNKIKLQNKK